jgi:hypothetical protein
MIVRPVPAIRPVGPRARSRREQGEGPKDEQLERGGADARRRLTGLVRADGARPGRRQDRLPAAARGHHPLSALAGGAAYHAVRRDRGRRAGRAPDGPRHSPQLRSGPTVRTVAGGGRPPTDHRPAAPPGEEGRDRDPARAGARNHCCRRREPLSAALGAARPARRDREAAGRTGAGDPAAQAAGAVAEGGGARERAFDRGPQGREPSRSESVAGDAGRADLWSRPPS